MKARVKISEATLQRLANGETITIRVGDVAELEIIYKPEPIDYKLKKAKALMDLLKGNKFDGLFDEIFGRREEL